MTDNRTYASLAVMHELNAREFRRKLGLFPEEMRYYVILANSIIGAENAKRVEETPEAVVRDGDEFVTKLLGMAHPEQNAAFREILETYLVETMKDELRYSCPNCSNFEACLDLDHSSVGDLFSRRVGGEETDELRNEIVAQIDRALEGAPHIHAANTHVLCKGFTHQCTVSRIGEVFNRYADIAAGLQEAYGIDYRKIQQAMISINMDFIQKSAEQAGRGTSEA